MCSPPETSYLIPRLNRRWASDESSLSCRQCNRPFGILSRKHHCRVCGRVFCHRCTTFVHIPDTLREHLPTPPNDWSHYVWGLVQGDQERACRPCSAEVRRARRVDDILQALLLCTGLAMPDWVRIRALGDDFERAVDMLRGIWRRIQYTAHWAGERCTETQRGLLRANARFLVNHSHWWVVAMREGIRPDPIQRHIDCADLLCQHRCSGVLMTPADCIEILLTSTESMARQMARSSLIHTAQDVIRCFVTTLVYVAVASQECVDGVLVPLARRDPAFAHECYWRVRAGGLVCNVLQEALLAAVDPDLRHELMMSEAWAQSFELAFGSRRPVSYRQTIMAPWRGRRPCLPGTDRYRVVHTDVGRAIVKPSSTFPIVVPIRLECCDTGDVEERHVLYKRDTDILTDALVMDVLKYVDACIHRDTARRYPSVCYHVLPLSTTTGLLLMVPRSRTLYSISTANKTLLNHVLDLHPNRSANDIRNGFAASAAFSSTTAFVLGIGDRHLENIMVDGDGRLFHVDFSYVLGQEPGFKRPLASFAPRIRLTRQIVNALGGADSEHYEGFKQHCSLIFGTCKREAKGIFYLMYALVAAGGVTRNRLQTFILRTLQPGQALDDATLEIEETISHATHCRTVDRLLDQLHHYANVLSTQ